jgi:hypothetical protein
MRTFIRLMALVVCALFGESLVNAQTGTTNKPIVEQVFGNPALNPYMNPYAANVMPNNPDFLLYMQAANQANGGIGSGVISGTRPGPGLPAGSQPQSKANQGQGLVGRTPYSGQQPHLQKGAKAALMPMATTVPGAGAAGFFNGGFASTNKGAGKFYNRSGGRFQNNGR